MALESVGKIDGFDKDGKARRVIVYRRNGKSTLFALAARRHVIDSTEVDYVAEAAQAFGISGCEFHQD